jgi:hypothetical protein
MPITVTCSCGRKLSAKDEYAGRTVKCPGCEQPLKIPAPAQLPQGQGPAAKSKSAGPKRSAHSSSAAQLLEEVGLGHHTDGPTCPECGQSVLEDALLCVHCGYNFKLKRRIHTRFETDDPEETSRGSKRKGPRVAAPKNRSNKPLTETDKTLAQAALDLEKEPIEQDRGYGTKSGAWFLMLIMLAVLASFIAGGMALVNYIEGRAAQSSQEDDRW